MIMARMIDGNSPAIRGWVSVRQGIEACETGSRGMEPRAVA